MKLYMTYRKCYKYTPYQFDIHMLRRKQNVYALITLYHNIQNAWTREHNSCSFPFIFWKYYVCLFLQLFSLCLYNIRIIFFCNNTIHKILISLWLSKGAIFSSAVVIVLTWQFYWICIIACVKICLSLCCLKRENDKIRICKSIT